MEEKNKQKENKQREFLERLGLSQYFEKFVEDGLTIPDIDLFTEEELVKEYGMKLLHAKKLKKEASKVYRELILSF